MPPRLIVNADDFGLTRGVNRAISELHTAGAATSATLMANGPAFEDAVTIAQQYPGLGIGCHVVLTDGMPLSPLKKIRTLLGEDGKSFRASLPQFLSAVLRGKVAEAEIELEVTAQIQRLQDAGIIVTHVDTHKHTHILLGVARPLLTVAERCGIRAIRNPFEPSWSLALGKSAVKRQLQVRIIQALRPRFLALPQIRNGRVLTTDGTLGVSATGNLNATTLAAITAAMPEGTWELVCHPGYNDTDLDAITTRLRASRETERDALLTAFGPNSPNPLSPHLIHYADLMHLPNP